MRCKCLVENFPCRIVQTILYSPSRRNRWNKQDSTRLLDYRELLVSLMRCKCRIEHSTCRMVQKISICQIERIGQIKLLFSPIESSWQYWTWMTKFLKRIKNSNHKRQYFSFRLFLQSASVPSSFSCRREIQDNWWVFGSLKLIRKPVGISILPTIRNFVNLWNLF